jgi:DNA mismatch repair protein MutS2
MGVIDVDERALEGLEFGRILALLQADTATPAGARLAAALRPSSDPETVRLENELTAEAVRHLDRHGALPFGMLTDPVPLLSRLEIEGSVLGPLEILDLLTLMKAGRRLKSFLAESRAGFPRLWALARELPDLGNLVRFLDGKIAGTGALEDGASDELLAIRQDLRRRHQRLQEVLDGIAARPEVARVLQDTFVSIRSERHVLPVRAEAQQAFPGIVHGVSGTGATVFIEPLETVDLNNALVTLRDRETAEVQRLLREYSELLRGRLPELRALDRGLGRLDLAGARARLGRRLGGRPAEAGRPDQGIVLDEARHPLVESSLAASGGRMVPLRLTMADGDRVLVISGPNAGGKTVALKTVGLLSLMFQAGIVVPAARAVLPVFRRVFIDIGDRQSISDRLSTFSARLQTVGGIAAALEPPCLVLLDEIGAGTDPEDGAALATAVLDYFRERGATVIATTHLEAVKAYAAAAPGSANAAMEFDEATGEPTYRLLPGIPGKSGGLEIAARLGFPDAILSAARGRRGRSGALIASYLARLQEATAALEKRLRDLDTERERLAGERERLLREVAEREQRSRRALTQEVELALRAMREEGERYLAGLEDRRAALVLRRQEGRAAAGLRATARSLIRRVSGATGPGGTPPAVTRGMEVVAEGLGVRGVVESLRGERLVLLVRGKRMTVPLAECRPAGGASGGAGPGDRLPRPVRLSRRAGAAVPGDLRLLGQTVDEALGAVDKYLDDAALAGLTPVRLVHGLGSGRLRRAISEFLARHPHVEAFRSAPENQGGAGVTIVDLKV